MTDKKEELLKENYFEHVDGRCQEPCIYCEWDREYLMKFNETPESLIGEIE